MKRALAALCAVAAIAACAPAWSPQPAAAQSTPAIVLQAIPSWVPAASPFTLGITLAPEADAIVVSAFSPVSTRSAFEDSLQGKGIGRPITSVTVAKTAPNVAANGRSVTIGLQPVDSPRDEQTLNIRKTGVYPLRIEAQRNGTSLGAVDTQLVVVDTATPPVGQRLNLAWVWPLATPPAHLPDGTRDPAIVAQWRPDGRVGRLVGAMAANPQVPVTVAPSPEMLQSWTEFARDDAELAGVLGDLRAQLVAPRQTLATPYVPLDLPSLLDHGLGNRIPPEIAAGTDVLTSTLGTRIDPRTAVAQPVDPAALGALREAGVDRVVVDASALVPVNERFTPAAPITLQADGRKFAAWASDDGLVSLLLGTDAPAVRAQRFLAWCSVVAQEQPNARRAVVAAMPLGWDIPRDTADAVLGGLAYNPLVQPITLESLFDGFVGASAPTRELRSITPLPPAVTDAELRSAEQSLASFVGLAGADDPIAIRGRRSLLTSLSAFWADDQARARAELQSISKNVGAFVANVKTPSDRTVTITARRARLPVAILNQTGKPLRVRVSVASDKLFFPNGASQTVDLPPRASTVNFIVETRASGTFPLTVDVTSENGDLAVASSRLTVRSTVVSGVGVFLTVGAAIFLIGWWSLHARKTRRNRRVRETVDA